MTETVQHSTPESLFDIHILGLNADKTRRMIGSETMYQVYLELSSSPPQGWRIAFEQEWKKLIAGRSQPLPPASIDRTFLLIHCPLQEIASYVPVLKKAVAAANIAYRQYVGKQATEQKSREDVWQDERSIVEDVAKSLHFD